MQDGHHARASGGPATCDVSNSTHQWHQILTSGLVNHQKGLLYFLNVPQHMGIAQDVLSKVNDVFGERGQEKIWAFDDTGYHFYRYGSDFPREHWPFAWLTDYQPYALSLLGLNGYEIQKKGICLHMPDYQLAPPRHHDSELQIQLTHQDRWTRPNLTIEVIRGAATICKVLISSLEFSAPYQSQACYVDGFGTSGT